MQHLITVCAVFALLLCASLAIEEEDMDTSISYEDRAGPCSCGRNMCSCCVNVNVKAFKMNRRACVEVEHHLRNMRVGIRLKMNDKAILSQEVSVRNPPPICSAVPGLPLNMCVALSDVGIRGNKLHTCIRLQAKAAFLTVLNLRVGCLNIGRSDSSSSSSSSEEDSL